MCWYLSNVFSETRFKKCPTIDSLLFFLLHKDVHSGRAHHCPECSPLLPVKGWCMQAPVWLDIQLLLLLAGGSSFPAPFEMLSVWATWFLCLMTCEWKCVPLLSSSFKSPCGSFISFLPFTMTSLCCKLRLLFHLGPEQGLFGVELQLTHNGQVKWVRSKLLLLLSLWDLGSCSCSKTYSKLIHMFTDKVFQLSIVVYDSP